MSAVVQTQRILPEGFEALERFVDRWCVEGTDDRIAVRSESSMGEIREFYDAVVPRAVEAVRLTDRYSLNDMPSDIGRLCRMLLCLPHVATAVEVIGAPRVLTAPYPNTIRVVRGSVPFG